MQPIELKPSLFARLGRNYIVKVSLKAQADDSFPKLSTEKFTSGVLEDIYLVVSCLKKNLF